MLEKKIMLFRVTELTKVNKIIYKNVIKFLKGLIQFYTVKNIYLNELSGRNPQT